MAWQFCIQTDQGLLRKNNEDSASFDLAAGLALLADGMGGYNAGEVASSMAVSTLQVELGRWIQEADPGTLSPGIEAALSQCMKHANRLIFESALANPAYRGMGTTLVVGVFRNTQLVLGHIGDSRCYRMRSRQLTQITKDHTILQAKIDAGLLTVEQASSSPGKNLLTRALGVDLSTEIEVSRHEVLADDMYLMCSDGLTDMVHSEDIQRTLTLALPIEERAKLLVAQANMNGGRDNITVLLAHKTAAPKTL